ncbi:MAG: bifunctional 4-hydroxy-2-oxoglutarate aldolase/2-dehydro-3-deoxy-phosphogluconate aldolase [Planctomycetia bacterium]|nr:bifunctional 4-hydroxy-2-oxoglutarate aldolase/2-dehydro-3-deoxy-phosphogluconate aldolase [Planctomycetia bacterium]
MQTIFNSTIVDRIANCGLVAVLIMDRVEDAVPCAKALLEGGVDVMELTLRTDAALGALEAIRRDVPDMLAGVGTIIFPEQVQQAQDAGAAFGVSPGLQRGVMDEAMRLKFPFAPGIMTPSELELALSYGCRNVKFFPSEPLGGLSYLKSIQAPYAHLGVRFLPLGGLTLVNLPDYMNASYILAAGGSWIAPRKLIAARDWTAITKNAADARKIIRQIRG